MGREREEPKVEREGSIIIKLFLENEVLKAFEEVLIKLDIRLSPIFSKFRHSFKTHIFIFFVAEWRLQKVFLFGAIFGTIWGNVNYVASIANGNKCIRRHY